MERQTVIERLTAGLNDIFAFSVSRLYNKQDAEDLTNDIIVEVIASADRLQNDEAFYGYMWRIAENTFKRFIRKKKREDLIFSEDFSGVYWDTPEEKCIESEELAILRRELSLLSRQYRTATIKYYIENKTCLCISREMNISEEMVKYYLFKTRKILKEGVNMERKFGEKSYNPGTFHINFWGSGGNAYIWEAFQRKLPGNIVLAAYEKPVSIEELSLELGVSAPYLEDELDILVKYNFVKQVGSKYQTDFLIFTKSYEEEFQRVIPANEICMKTIRQIIEQVENCLDGFRGRDLGIKLDDNSLRWFIVNFAFINALGEFEEKTQWEKGTYPRLNATTSGFVYGHDNDYTYGYFSGIYGHCENSDNTAWYTAVNYNAIKRCQWWKGISYARTDTLCDAILQKAVVDTDSETAARLVSEGMIRIEADRLKANFPTFTSRDNHIMRKELAEIINQITGCMDEICRRATEIFKKYTPKNFHDRCEHVCYVRHQADAMGIIVERLVKDGYLAVPDGKVNLCMFGIKKKSKPEE